MRHLAVVTKEYPSPGEPVYTFVEQLVNAIADSGVRVTVLSPVNPMKRALRGAFLPPAREVRVSPSGRGILLLRPRALSFGVRKAAPSALRDGRSHRLREPSLRRFAGFRRSRTRSTPTLYTPRA